MGSSRWILMCCLLIIGSLQESENLVIKGVRVPETVRVGKVDHVILDCDYDLENTLRTGLVVTWYLNEYEKVYQWIYGTEPQATETFLKYIDLEYKASEDNYTMYRAMKLNNPDIELSGEYKCTVSTYADELSSKKKMVVYATEDKFELVTRKKSVDNKEGVEVTCLAEGLYPKPTLDISVGDVVEKQAASSDVELLDDGHYRIQARLSVQDEDLPSPSVIECVLGIPEANYNVSRDEVYYPGPPTTTPATTTKLQRKLEIQALNDSQPNSDNGGGSSAITASTNVFLMTMTLPLTALLGHLSRL